MSKRYWAVHISYTTFAQANVQIFLASSYRHHLWNILFDLCDRLSWFNQLLICTLKSALSFPITIKSTTYSAVSFFPPPRDGTNVLLSADFCSGTFLAGGLLMATDIVFSPIWWPSIFSTACVADVCTHTYSQQIRVTLFYCSNAWTDAVWITTVTKI